MITGVPGNACVITRADRRQIDAYNILDVHGEYTRAGHGRIIIGLWKSIPLDKQ